MLGKAHWNESTSDELGGDYSGCLRMYVGTCGVTVLLLFLGNRLALAAQDAETRVHVFEFRCEFRIPAVSGHLDGFMASDGRQQRIALHWVEPYIVREAPSFVRCCDFVFSPSAIDYWVAPGNQRGTIHLADVDESPPQVRPVGTESIIRRTLAIVERLAVQDVNAPAPSKLAEFFVSSRGLPEYAYESLPPEVDEGGPKPPGSDAQMASTSPSGRRYSKEKRPDGTLVWRAGRVASRQSIATITIKPPADVNCGDDSDVFDSATLGQWPVIPELYRVYWAFDQAYRDLMESSDKRDASHTLCDQIELRLNTSSMPCEVSQALKRLRFKASLLTDDNDRVWLSVQDVVTGLCDNKNVPVYQRLFELGSMSGDIQRQYPQQMEKRLRPLVTQMVDCGESTRPDDLQRIMATVASNGWFVFGELLLAEIRDRHLADEHTVDVFATRFDAARLARERTSADPGEPSESVRQYLCGLDAAPREGTIDVNGIRDILNRGLARQYPDDIVAVKQEIVENVVKSIVLIAGEGPFRADAERLVASVDRFSRHCLIVNGSTEPIDSVLATFLALSFYDVSTPSDHELLLSQFQQSSKSVQCRVNAMLTARELNSLVTAEDVRRAFQIYERIVQRYIDDPLWPIYKFPLTPREETRLTGKLRLSLIESEPFLDEVSLKVKYGGASEELKDALLEEVSRSAQALLPYSAFLRIPPQMGISCQYKCGYGFSVIAKGSLYLKDEHPRELFRRMTYFHLGHRLEDIGERKQELTRTLGNEELKQ